jgi:hypothetical protein
MTSRPSILPRSYKRGPTEVNNLNNPFRTSSRKISFGRRKQEFLLGQDGAHNHFLFSNCIEIFTHHIVAGFACSIKALPRSYDAPELWIYVLMTTMKSKHIERKLWYEDNGRVTTTQAEALQRSEPLIILGEAGMGKTSLLRWIARSPDYVLCTARSLITHPNPRRLLGSFRVLVIDAIDEVSAHKQGDAVDLVLGRLAELGVPRFILSCRVADWRSATAVEGIRGQYGCNLWRCILSLSTRMTPSTS